MKTTEARSVIEGKKLNRAIRIDEAQIRSHLDTLVRDSVEDTLNKLLDSEADRLCNARRYEYSEERTDRRAGHYPRKLQTRVGEVQLKLPRLRQAALDTLIIERYRRKEASIEESLVEMYLAGLSVRTVEDMSEQLVGSRVSASTVSDLNQKIYQRIELWRNHPLGLEVLGRLRSDRNTPYLDWNSPILTRKPFSKGQQDCVKRPARS